MKTVIQELIDVVEMDYDNGVQISMPVFYKMLVKAKEKEMHQIFDAFVAGDERGTGEIPFNAEQYYTQTFSNKDDSIPFCD